MKDNMYIADSACACIESRKYAPVSQSQDSVLGIKSNYQDGTLSRVIKGPVKSACITF